MKTTGNSMFIPGGTSGIGLGLALRFHAAGNTVIVAGRRREKLEDVRTNAFLDTAAEVITTNLLGSIRLIGAFTEFLAGKPGATIMTVSSGLAFAPMAATPTYSATKAAIHAFGDGIRVQLRSSGIQIIELAPPAVQTDLMPGQAEAQWAMPIEDFLTEVMSIVTADPDVREILVDNVKPLRYSEINGNRDEIMDQLAGLTH